MSVKERERARKKLLCRITAVAVILLLLTGLLLILLYWEDQQTGYPEQTGGEITDGNGPYDNDQQQTVRYDGKWYVLRDNIETVLLIGLDSMGENDIDESSFYNENKADFLMLLVIDREREMCRVLHINRDSMAEVTVLGVGGQKITTSYEQLTLAHTYGSGGQDSCLNTAEAVSKFLYNTPIDHYVSLNMAAVPILNDAVGGVTVTVLDDFSGINDRLVEGKSVSLIGEDALTYVRARAGLEDSSNVRRMERQRQYMSALYQQISGRIASDAGFGLEMLLRISEYFLSDCTAQKLSDLMNVSVQYGFEGFDTIKGEAIVGEKFMEFYPDEDALQKQIIDLFYEEKNE